MNLGKETETLEFKKSTGELKEAMNSICAILNKHQKGELYFGIKPDGTPIGQVVTEETLRDVSQKIGNAIEPKIYPNISNVVIDGKDCICVRFEGSDVPYFAYGVAKIRVADEDLTLSPHELTEYIRQSQQYNDRWEDRVSDKSVDCADEELLKAYVRTARDGGRLAIEYTDKKTVLNQLELTQGDYLINAGKVLFSEDITQDIQLAIFATTERTTFNDIKRSYGPVTKLVDLAEMYIRNNIRWRVEFDGSRERKEIPEIPMDAVREALLNSFCHKDYSSGQSNEVTIYKDRIEIYNPGCFPDGYDPEDFINNPERPIRRNPRIARILYYSKDIESFGTGLKRIALACEKAGTKYDFKKLKSGFVVCFYRSPEDEIVDNPENTTDRTENTTDRNDYATDRIENATDRIENATDRNKKATEKVMSERRQRVMKYVEENGFITNAIVREILCIEEGAAKRVIAGLTKSGQLVAVSEKRHRRYVMPTK